MKKEIFEKPFSDQLQHWLKSRQPKTIAKLEEVFAEKTFAIAIFLLMFLPALPLPTAGFSHVFEAITMLLALELIAGRRSIWLPERWQKSDIGDTIQKKVLPTLLKLLRKLEKISSPRFPGVMANREFKRIAGVVIFTFALAAFLAPPGVGLDTLPSIGVVLIALSIILGDIAFFFAGTIIGVAGIGIILFLGKAATEFIKGLF